MSYAVEFTPDARDQFDELPPTVGLQVLDQIELLAHHPTKLSKPGGTLFSGHQVTQFWGRAEAKNWWITLAFCYSRMKNRFSLPGLSFANIDVQRHGSRWRRLT